MPTVQTVYQGELRTLATHLQSGTELLTDAPTDNQGKGEAFSPTDLVATALGSCMMTIMGIVARREAIDLTGTTLQITKKMNTEGSRRIVGVDIVFKVTSPSPLSEAQKAKLEHAAHTCPVALSLHPDLAQTVHFEWS
jgi:uncharacterized OsmC-like protein